MELGGGPRVAGDGAAGWRDGGVAGHDRRLPRVSRIREAEIAVARTKR
jgi:hypothetical protein